MDQTSGDASAFERLRPVGRLERWSTSRHHFRFYLNVAITATYTLPSKCSLPMRSYVYKACETVIGRHPILSAIPVDESTEEAYFVRLPEVRLDDCVSFKERRHSSQASSPSDVTMDDNFERDVELDELLTAQHNTPFSPPSAFWRLCILTDPDDSCRFTAAFVYHHGLGDGTSGKAFHKTFLHALHGALSSLASPDEVKSIISPPQTRLLPNVEELLPMTVTLPFLLTALFKERFGNKRDPRLWTGSKITTPLKGEARHLIISKCKTTSLRDICRQNKTTVTAALHTVIAAALFDNIPEQFSLLNCSGALSTRKWLGTTITDDSMGVWVQDLQETYSREKFLGQGGTIKFPWDEAKRSRKTIEKALKMRGKNAKPNLLKYVNDYQQLFLPKVGKDRESSYELSGLGAFQSDLVLEKSDQGPRIGRMIFSQSASVVGSALQVSVITGEDGCMVVAFSWQEGVVEADLVDRVMQTVSKQLNSFSK